MERTREMIKEEKKEVKAVQVVLEVFKEYLDKEEDMPVAVMKYVVELLNQLERDYDKTIREVVTYNSLSVKLEKYIELIGTIGTISIEDLTKLDKTLKQLEEHVESIKN